MTFPSDSHQLSTGKVGSLQATEPDHLPKATGFPTTMLIDNISEGTVFEALTLIFQNALQVEPSISLSSDWLENVWTCMQQGAASERSSIFDLASLCAVKDFLEQMLLRGSEYLTTAAKTLADATRNGLNPSPSVFIRCVVILD